MPSPYTSFASSPDRDGCAEVSGWLVLALFVVTVGLATIPIATNRFLSINDYLNHLARAAVLLNYPSDPGFVRFYMPNWRLLPNLAIDLWVLGIGQIFPVPVAGKLFVAATLALMLGGTIFLHRVTFGKWSLWPFLAIVFLYNRMFLAGILNFCFGIGLLLLVLALWIYLRSGHPLIRTAALAAGTLAVFFVHLFAFGILAVTIAAYELVLFASGDRPFHKRLLDLVAGAVPFLPAIAILVTLSPKTDASEVFRYRDIWSRISGFAAPLLYDWRLDLICYLILFALLAWAVAKKAIRVDPPLAAGVAALVALQFCIPNVIMTAEGADHRIPIPMLLLAIAATDPQRLSFKLGGAILATTAAVFAVRLVTIEHRWSQDQPAYAAGRAVLLHIPPGARVASAFAPDAFDNSSAPLLALYYMPVWSVVSRGGFTQTLFAFPTQQPLVLTPEFAAVAAASPPNAIWRAFVVGVGANSCAPPPQLMSALREYDYVALVDRRTFQVCHIPLLEPVADAGYTQVFRVNHGP